LSAAVLAATGALEESAGGDGVAVKLSATGALEESAGADGVAVELPAIVGVGDEGAGDAAGGAVSAIAGCRSVSSYAPSFVRRTRRCQVVKRVTATAPAAVRSTKPVPKVRSTKRVPTRGAGACTTLVVRQEHKGDRGTAATGTSDAAPCRPCTDTLPRAYLLMAVKPPLVRRPAASVRRHAVSGAWLAAIGRCEAVAEKARRGPHARGPEKRPNDLPSTARFVRMGAGFMTLSRSSLGPVLSRWRPGAVTRSLKGLKCCGPGTHLNWSGRNRPVWVVSRVTLGLNRARMRDSWPLLHQLQVRHDTGTAAHVSRPDNLAERTHQECKQPCTCTALSGAPSIFAYYLMVPPSHAGGPFA